MGRGNWFPGCHVEDCRVVYIDYSNGDIQEDDQDSWEWQWEWVKETIWECLPKSFVKIEDYRDLPHYLRQPHWNDCTPVAYNGLFTVWVDSQGDHWHQGIGLTVNEDAPHFAASRLDATADAFFDKLEDFFHVSVRTSAWTSAIRQKSNQPT
jgi:hypothetical protein